MEYTMEERCALICEACLTETSVDIIDIFEHIADCDFVRIHGPEHHIFDGAAFLAFIATPVVKLIWQSAFKK